MSKRLRLITTHDFFGCFAPVPTSYGALAGGAAVREAARSLRAGQPTLWVDSGDFSQSGPLSPLTQGVGGFRAAAELGIDVAALGNHDLDFGVELVQREAANLGFPLLCANAELGLPASTLIETEAGPIGFIGLTHPDLASMAHVSLDPVRAMPRQSRGEDALVPILASALRRDGARLVVAIVHDGVHAARDPSGQGGSMRSLLPEWCSAWAHHVDLIVGGHTCTAHIGAIGLTPWIQPWPFGTELGVVDIDLADASPEMHLGQHRVPPGGDWTGHGAELLAAAKADVLGALAAPLAATLSGDVSLPDFLARAVQRAVQSDLAMAYATCGQPSIDGCFAYLRAGAVSRLDILQIVPWSDHGLVGARLDAGELAASRQPGEYARTAWGVAGTGDAPTGAVTIATTAGLGAETLNRRIGRDLGWTPLNVTLFDAIRWHLADGAPQSAGN